MTETRRIKYSLFYAMDTYLNVVSCINRQGPALKRISINVYAKELEISYQRQKKIITTYPLTLSGITPLPKMEAPSLDIDGSNELREKMQIPVIWMHKMQTAMKFHFKNGHAGYFIISCIIYK